MASSVVPSLKNVILVDNSEGRVDVSKLGCTAGYGDLLEEQRGRRGREVVLEEEAKVDDIINSEFYFIFLSFARGIYSIQFLFFIT